MISKKLEEFTERQGIVSAEWCKLLDQVEIVEQRLAEAEKVIEFYGDKKNYIELCVDGATGNPKISSGDYVDCVVYHADRGYAVARNYIKKYKEVSDE
jgi:hypothetical protein